MRKVIIASFIILTIVSCKSPFSGSLGAATDIDPITRVTSLDNKMDLIVSDKGVQYTIDISTPEGAMNLKNKTLAQAKELVNSEAAAAHNCAILIRPKYTYLLDDKKKKILRITVFGFPARYRNSQPDYDYVPMNNRTKVEVVTKQK